MNNTRIATGPAAWSPTQVPAANALLPATGTAGTAEWWLCWSAGSLTAAEPSAGSALSRGSQAGADVVVAVDGHADNSGRLLSPAMWAAATIGAGLLRRRAAPGVGAHCLLAVREATVATVKPGPLGMRALATLLLRRPVVHVVTGGTPLSHGGTVRGASLAETLASVLVVWLGLFGDEARRMAAFLLIGAFGMALNSAITALGRAVLGLHYLAAALVAAEITSVCCFCLNETTVFADRDSGRGLAGRLLSFLLINNAAFVLRGPMMYGLTTGMGVHYLVSNVVSIVAFTLIRYALSTLWIWRPRRLSSSDSAHSTVGQADSWATDVAPHRTQLLLGADPGTHHDLTGRGSSGVAERAGV